MHAAPYKAGEARITPRPDAFRVLRLGEPGAPPTPHPGPRRALRRAETLALVALVAGCDPPAPPAEAPPPRWVYAPNPPAVALGELRGRLGRGQAPQLAGAAGVTGAARAPLRLATAFAVPGDGPARAVVYGLEGTQAAIELIELDAGRAPWRSTACTGPVVGVTADVTICSDGSGVRAIGHDGAARWTREGTFLAMTEDRVVVAGAGTLLVLEADDGDELASLALPRGVTSDGVLASCGDAGRELFAAGQDGRLVRITDGRVAWGAVVGAITELDACTGDTILARVRGAAGAAGAGAAFSSSVIAIVRATGRITGRVDGVRGVWRARDGSERLEVATAEGVARWPRTLAAAPELLPLPPLGELIAERGDARLVRATAHTALVLDAAGVRAHVPFAWHGGALGDTAALGTTWTGGEGEVVHRIGLPPRPRRALRVPSRLAVAPPAELRDLPAPSAVPVEDGAIAKPDTARYAVPGAALDPAEPAVVYAITLEAAPSDVHAAGLAAVDLAKRAWRWQRGDGCGPGEPIAVAVARGAIACAARTTTPRAATVTATSRDGASRWQWEGDSVDALAAGGAVVLVHDADRLVVLDAATGRARGHLASDDGAPMRAAAVALGDVTYLATYERGRIVVRLPVVGMLPVWSLAVDGVVRALAPSADGILVELEDGDAYRVELATAAVAPIPGVGLAWQARGDLITGAAAGAAIPPALARGAAVPLTGLQLALYELGGGLRARNDYPLAPPIAAELVRGPAGSPLVLASGPGLRDVLVLDPRTGAPLRRVHLPDDAAHRVVFGTVVDGTPVAGALLAAPLRAVVF